MYCFTVFHFFEPVEKIELVIVWWFGMSMALRSGDGQQSAVEPSIISNLLKQEYNVSFLGSGLETGKLQIKDAQIPLNCDFSFTSRMDLLKGLTAIAGLTNELSRLIEYQLPFECVLEGNTNAFFVFFQRKINLNQQADFVQFLSMLFFNILSICNAEGVPVKREKIPFAIFMLFSLANENKFYKAAGLNLEIPFNVVKESIANCINKNPPYSR